MKAGLFKPLSSASSILRCSAVLAIVILIPPRLKGQECSGASPPVRRTEPTFTLRVQKNVIIVRVIVRDSHGRTIGGLRKSDFKIS
jgi:hypothetical protein